MLDEIETSEFRFKVDRSTVLDVDVQWFIEMMHRWVANGERFKGGESIQMGWGLLKIRSNPDGSLSLPGVTVSTHSTGMLV